MPSDARLAVEYRGLTTVKGKGDLPTYFLHDADVQVSSQAEEGAALLHPTRDRDQTKMIAELRHGTIRSTLGSHTGTRFAASTGAPIYARAAAITESVASSAGSGQRSCHVNATSKSAVSMRPPASGAAVAEIHAEDKAVHATSDRISTDASAAAFARRVINQGQAAAAVAATPLDNPSSGVSASSDSSPGLSVVERISRRAAELSKSVRSVRYEDRSSSPMTGRAHTDAFPIAQADVESQKRELSHRARRASLGHATASSSLRHRSIASVSLMSPFATSRSDEAKKAGLSAFDACIMSDQGSTPPEAAAPFTIPPKRRQSTSCRITLPAVSQATDPQPARRNVIPDAYFTPCVAPASAPTLASIEPVESPSALSATVKQPPLASDQTRGQQHSCSDFDSVDYTSRPVRASVASENLPQDVILAIADSNLLLRRSCAGSVSSGAFATRAAAPSSWRQRTFDAVSQLWSGFEDVETERAAQRALFLHVLTAMASAYPLWIVAWIVVVVGYATLSVNTARAIRCVGYTLVPLGSFFALAVTARIVRWNFRDSTWWSPTAMRIALWSLTCTHVCIVGLILWVASGPETAAMFVPAASAASLEPPTVPDYQLHGPFEGQLLCSLVAVGYVQQVAHSRLPFLHTCAFSAATLLLTLCMVVPRLVLTGGTLPPSAVGSSAFAIFLGLAANFLTSVVSAFVWEGRCRTQLLSASATTATQAAATSLLNNLMPPSVVADMVAGREVRPALARNVVVLVSLKLKLCRSLKRIPRPFPLLPPATLLSTPTSWVLRPCLRRFPPCDSWRTSTPSSGETSCAS